MLRVGSVVAALTVAAALACADYAAAADSAEEADPVEDSAPHEQSHKVARLLLFSGADLWHQGNFLYGGSVWAPFGLDADGLAVKLLTTRGFYRYRSGALGNASVIGDMSAVAVMPGLHFTRNGVVVTVYAGLDRQDHELMPDDVANPARGHHLGVRTAAELWAEPTAQTMVTASATLTTIASAYALRAATGWRIAGLYVGPEAQYFGSDNYRQWRIGLHVTGLTLATFELQAGVGYAADADDNGGLYVHLGVTRKR